MASPKFEPWIPADRVATLLDSEPAFLIAALALSAWLIYKLFLRGVSVERHRNLRRLFKNLSFHIAAATILFVAYFALQRLRGFLEGNAVGRLDAYVGFFALLFWSSVFVKTARILLFEYLFLSHMKVAVPLLLVNLFTLLLSVLVAGWFATELFGVRLAPLLATSAIVSIVLGLALQDTLGNLFAGVALQFDKPYEIGDWVQIQNDVIKVVGQVSEISWRATVLVSFTDELITVPNRVVGQSEISNYSHNRRQVIRSQVFRIGYGEARARVKEELLAAVDKITGIARYPEPIVLMMETTESWVVFKLIYYVSDFGAQYVIGDRVLSACLDRLDRAGVNLAPSRIEVLRQADGAGSVGT